MVKRYNRLLVAFYVVSDALLAMWAFLLAYAVRFESGLIAVQKGYPPVEHYLQVLPFVAVLVPLAFQIQGVYRLRRGRSRVDDEVLRDEYRAARAVILPGEEDFGIVPLAAQACGRPVVALARGGALETVKNGQTGLLFPEPTAASLAETLRVASTWRFDSFRIRLHAESFSRESHAHKLRAVIDDTMASPIEQRW